MAWPLDGGASRRNARFSLVREVTGSARCATCSPAGAPPPAFSAPRFAESRSFMLNRFVALASLGRRTLPNLWDIVALGARPRRLRARRFRLARHDAAARGAGDRAISRSITGRCPITACARRCACSRRSAVSLLFTFIYATLAAKSRRAEMLLIPLLDILQSVPVLGFLSFTVTFFLGLFPGRRSARSARRSSRSSPARPGTWPSRFYQSLRTVPRDLDEVARELRPLAPGSGSGSSRCPSPCRA